MASIEKNHLHGERTNYVESIKEDIPKCFFSCDPAAAHGPWKVLFNIEVLMLSWLTSLSHRLWQRPMWLVMLRALVFLLFFTVVILRVLNFTWRQHHRSAVFFIMTWLGGGVVNCRKIGDDLFNYYIMALPSAKKD